MNKGFTLIELLIVVAILGLLYAIALPAYTDFVQDGRRADIQRELLQHVTSLERTYTRSGGYPATYTATDTEFYTFSYSAAQNTAFLLSAIPVAGKAQHDDPCGTLTVDHQGVKTPSQTSCWGK